MHDPTLVPASGARVRRQIGALLITLLALTAACSETWPTAAETTVVDGAEVFVMQETCPDDTGCPAGFRIGDIIYRLECFPAEATDGALYAVAPPGVPWPYDQARVLPGIDPTLRLAAHFGGTSLCSGVSWPTMTSE